MTREKRIIRPTMKHVAEYAGVSISVVSRVCHPRPKEYVSEETKLRVMNAISSLGYYPDSRARSLHSRRTQTIGFYSATGPVSVENDFSRVVFEGLQAGCGRADQDLLVFHGMNNRPDSDIVRELSSSKVDGVIHQPNSDDSDLAALILQSHKPTVRIGEPFPNIPTVVAEDWNGAYRLAHHLHLRGHRKVMFRKNFHERISQARRYDGFCAAARELNMTVITTMTNDLWDELTDEENSLILGFRSAGITAIACWCDISAATVLLYCHNHKIHVPEDLAVVGFDGLTPSNCPPQYRITTVVTEWGRIGELAVDLLLKVIEGEDVPDELVHPCALYMGNTS